MCGWVSDEGCGLTFLCCSVFATSSKEDDSGNGSLHTSCVLFSHVVHSVQNFAYEYDLAIFV